MCYRWSAVKAIALMRFAGYSLSEDFDFSYRIGKVGKLVADPSIVEHHHSALNRNWEQFGYMRIKTVNICEKHWPKQLKYWLGMWWANLWLMVINGLRGLYAQRYWAEFKGLLRGILTN